MTTSTRYALLDAARQAIEARDGHTAQRLLGMVLTQSPDHLEARHLAAFAAYCVAFGDRPIPNFDNALLTLCTGSGSSHLNIALALANGGHAEAAVMAFRTAALLDFHLVPVQGIGFGGPFNGQPLRAEAFRAIARTGRIAELIETGAHRGTTTEFMARHVNCPVKTTERHRYYFEWTTLRFEDLRQMRCPWAANLELHNLDSRAFLAEMMRQPAPASGFSFFYLDAHGDYLEDRKVENPLLGEIRLIRPARHHCIIMIDDTGVPDDPGYAFDNGNAFEDVAPVFPHFDAWFLPQSARHESGSMRGCLVLSGSPETTALLSGVPELRRGEAG